MGIPFGETDHVIFFVIITQTESLESNNWKFLAQAATSNRVETSQNQQSAVQ